jgi:tripartite-type tricarboxylate transporter receptor subunit TctC
VPGYEVNVWYGIFAPRNTPPDVIAALNKAIGVALTDPKVTARFAEVGGLPMPMSPAELSKYVADDTEKWRKVVEFAGIKLE